MESVRTWLARPWAAPLVIGVLALGIRLLYLLQIKENPFFYHPIVDCWIYHDFARNILESGDWIGNKIFYQAPLYPYFLAFLYNIFGFDLIVPRLIQALLGALNAVGIFMLGRRLFGDRAAWISGLGAVFYATLIFFDGELLAPTITIFLDLAVFLIIFKLNSGKRWGLWCLPGFLFGLRALAATNILVTAPVFLIWIYLKSRHGWTRKQALLSASAFTAGIVLAIAPVTIRNYALEKDFVLVSYNAGLNFYIGNSGDYDGKVAIRPGIDWSELTKKPLRAGRTKKSERSSYFFKEAWKYISSHPGAYLKLLARKAYLFFHGNEALRNQSIYPFREHSSLLKLLLWKAGIPGGPGLAFPFGLLLPLALPGIFLVFRRRHGRGKLLLGFALVYALSVIAFFITARYRLPLIPILLLMAGFGWACWKEWWHSPKLRYGLLAGMAVLFALSNWNPGTMPKTMNRDAYYSLADTHRKQGNIQKAEKYYKKVIALDPNYAEAWLNLGRDVYQKQGLLQEAERCFLKALAIRPRFAKAVSFLGYLALLRKQPARAAKLFQRATLLDPLLAEPYHNLANMALRRRQYKIAAALFDKAIKRDPGSVDTLVGLAVTTFKLRGMEAAMPFFERARNLDPGDFTVYLNLAIVYAQVGRYGDSIGAIRKSLSRNPRQVDAYGLYTEQMLKAGRGREARNFLESAARGHPTLPGPIKALKKLQQAGY